MVKVSNEYQLFCPFCITEMLLTETLKRGAIFLCPKCGFQLNIDLTELMLRQGGDEEDD